MEQITDVFQNSMKDIAFDVIKSLLGGFAIGLAIAFAVRFLLKAINKKGKISEALIAEISSKVCALVTLAATIMIYLKIV